MCATGAMDVKLGIEDLYNILYVKVETVIRGTVEENYLESVEWWKTMLFIKSKNNFFATFQFAIVFFEKYGII